MKKIFILLSISAITAFSSCDNKNEGGCIQVKVVEELCGTAILQVISGDLGGEIASSWTNHKDETFSNVFTTFLDACDPNYPQAGETFYVKIVNERVESDCAVCLALLANAPEQYNHVVITPECGINTGVKDF